MAEPIVADKNYYRDAEHNLVEEGDPKAAFLVAAKGTEVEAEIAEKYGITAAPAEEQAEEKAMAPKANKSAAPAKNKGAK